MFEEILAEGLPLVASIISMIREAKTASAERSAQILAQLQAADGALDAAATAAHNTVDSETAQTQAAIAAHKDPTP